MSFEPSIQTTSPSPSISAAQGNRRLGCCLLPLLGIALLLGWVGWKLAASGVVHVPALSSIAYTTQGPTAVVEPSLRSLEQLLTASLASKDKTFSVSLDSPLLTRALHDGLRRVGLPTSGSIGTEQLISVAAQARVVSAEKGIELFLPFVNEGRNTTLTAHVLPILLPSGEVHLDVRDVQIGSTDVPAWLLKFGVDQLEQEIDRQLNELIVSNVELTNLQLTSDNLTLSGRIR